jgi:histidyl-tRNA synthetase
MTSGVVARVRGMADLLDSALKRRQRIEAAFASATTTHRFRALQTPIVEQTRLFTRSLGAASDLVRKEMFTLQTRGDDADALCLRPEGTLPAIRALIECNGVRALPQRVRYCGPFFRHERPQRGRLRQFTQLGVEALASKSLAGEDAELIAMAARFLADLGVGAALQLRINSLGTPHCRAAYETTLLAPYLAKHRGELSEASQAKLADGRALRVLDSADAKDVDVVRGAPLLSAALDAHSRARFDNVRAALGALGVEYALDERLVRGLDYYTHTIFEFVSDDKLGRQQRTALAGGRYDGVVGALGGPKHVASFGWAAGVERLELLLHEDADEDADESAEPLLAVVVARVDDGAEERDEDGSGAVREVPLCRASLAALSLTERLRSWAFAVTHEHGGSLKRQLNRAHKAGAKLALVVGDRELDRNVIVVRDLASGAEREHAHDDVDGLARLLADATGVAGAGELLDGGELDADEMREHLAAIDRSDRRTF